MQPYVQLMVLKQVIFEKRLECNWHTFIIFPLSCLVEGSDYSTADPLEVTFMSGSAIQNSTSCAQISIIDDLIFEGPHSFSVEVSTVEIESDGTDPLLTIGTTSSAAVIIGDNDGKPFSYVLCMRITYNISKLYFGNISVYLHCCHKVSASACDLTACIKSDYI